jgi:hypothetical protein
MWGLQLMNGYPNMKKKLVEINDTSSRSRGGNKTLVKPKETDGAGAGEEKLFIKKIKRLFNIRIIMLVLLLIDLTNLIKKKINKRLHKI